MGQQSNQIEKLREENQQLKQELHDLPKKIVEEIKKFNNAKSNKIPDENGWFNPIRKGMSLDEFLATILEKFGGEDESK